jgi:hypothetical protein
VEATFHAIVGTTNEIEVEMRERIINERQRGRLFEIRLHERIMKLMLQGRKPWNGCVFYSSMDRLNSRWMEYIGFHSRPPPRRRWNKRGYDERLEKYWPPWKRIKKKD